MAIDAEEVRRIAALARLEIPDQDLERTARQLSEVLDFVAALERLELADLEPRDLAPAAAPLREDAPDDRCLTPDQALAAAPESENGFFLVPPIIENVSP